MKDRAVAERLVRKIDVEFDGQWQPLPLRLATLLELCPLSRDALSVDEMGDPDVSMVRRQSVIAYRDRLLEEGKATETINTRLSFIRILLGIAKDRGFVEVNHADDTALAEDKRLWSCIRRSSPAIYELGFP